MRSVNFPVFIFLHDNLQLNQVCFTGGILLGALKLFEETINITVTRFVFREHIVVSVSRKAQCVLPSRESFLHCVSEQFGDVAK